MVSSCREFNYLSYDTKHMLKDDSIEGRKADACYTYSGYMSMSNVENAVLVKAPRIYFH